MGVTINKKSTITEQPPENGQQPKPLAGLNAFYWYQIFALDSAVVEVQEMLSLHGSLLTLFTETGKANALNDQFQPVFSPNIHISLKSLAQKKSLQGLHASRANLPFQPSPHPKMPHISIAAEGIDKLLVCLKPHKATGPNKFKLLVLQTFHKELAPILQLIFQRSIDTGKIPDICKEANVSPIYRKRQKIRPIQLQANPTDLQPSQLVCFICLPGGS